MPHNYSSNLWPNKTENFFFDKIVTPIAQTSQNCVRTSLAMLADTSPETFQNGVVNTQDPISWSGSLIKYGMKLAYCPFDVRKLKFYMNELIELNDLFLLCYYTTYGADMLNDPDDTGWVCGSHVVILHKDKIYDPQNGDITFAKNHYCNEKHTKRIFRVVPAEYARGI